MKDKINNKILIILQIANFCVFAGRSYQHLFWDAPFRTLLWDEEWMSGIVHSVLGMNWEDYITNLKVDDAIQNLIQWTGIFYLCCALIVVFIRRLPKWLAKVLVLGASFLIVLAALTAKEKFFSIGQFFEYTLQFSSPLFLYFFVFKNIEKEKTIFWMKVAIALTFICHGLYAIGYYPRPGGFVDMTISIFSCSDETAVQFLNVVGLLDFVVAVGIFLPKQWAKPILIYAMMWGFATTMARLWANYYPEYIVDLFHQWGFEMLVRTPHFLIPLVVYQLYNNNNVKLA